MLAWSGGRTYCLRRVTHPRRMGARHGSKTSWREGRRVELNPGLGFTEEQEMLRESVRAVLREQCPLPVVRAMEQDEDGFPVGLWRQIAALGWLGMMAPEEHGGSGGSFLEAAMVLDEMGRALFPAPYLWTTLCGQIVAAQGSKEQRSRYLPAVVAGEALLTLAWTEAAGRWEADGLATRLEGARVYGEKCFVPYAGSATHLLVGAQEGGRCVVCIVPRRQSAITVAPLRTAGWDKQDVVTLDGAVVEEVLPHGEAVLEQAIALGAAMQCMLMAGMAQRVLEMTRDYAKSRVQFGRPIGNFQAVQHHLADMAVDTDISRAMSYQLAQRIAEGKDYALEASLAKVFVAQAAARVMDTGHQVHGGIGLITDHAMQMYFLRVKPLVNLLGDVDFHLRRVERALPAMAAGAPR